MLDIGKKNSINFGQDIKKIYSLDDSFLNETLCLSSPYKRCLQTITHINKGLGINREIIETDLLRYGVDYDYLNHLLNTYEAKEISMKFIPLINKLNNIFKINISNITELYDVHSSIICYKDLGINMSQYIDDSIEKELNNAVLLTYNYTNYYAQNY